MVFASHRRLLSQLAVLLVSLAATVGTAHAEQTSVIVDGTSGMVLSESHADDAHAPASLTKMMTLYLAFQALRDHRLTLGEEIPVSSHAASMAPTKLGLRRGQSITVRDCILAMITKSANDAATVMAEKLGGSESRFVESMNAQAILLGMGRTHFANASGLPGGYETTTARDMSRLAMALYRDFPNRSQYFATTEFRFRGHLVKGHNHLMERYEGMDGLKTGYTNAAGFNLASTAIRGGHRLFGVVLGGHTWRARDNAMAQLLDRGFADRAKMPTMLAEGRHTPGMSRRVLNALSPIGTAEADPAPAARRPVGANHAGSGAALKRPH